MVCGNVRGVYDANVLSLTACVSNRYMHNLNYVCTIWELISLGSKELM